MSEAALAEAPPASRADELIMTGHRLFHENQIEAARLHFLAALSVDPYHAIAWQNLGAALRCMNQHHAAMVAAQRSVVLTKRENPYALSNLGVSYLGTRQYAQAQKTLLEVAQRTGEAPALHNYGLVLYMMGKYSEALVQFERSLGLMYNPMCASDRALTLLSLGKVADGLAAYECRWETLWKNRIWDLKIPEWKGESLEGTRILVHHEQGFGDSIMLVRFLRQLAEKKCHITLAVPEGLVRLFQGNFPFVKVLAIDDERISEASGFDYHSPLLSVMRHVGITRPDDISSAPYLTSSGKGSPINLPKAKKRIGVCWASGDHAPSMRDRRRLVPLTLFLPLLDDLDVSLVSLQVGENVKDIVANGLEGIVFDASPKIKDFADTADVIDDLDLVISVDSAVAHLAGALGKPCLVLSPYTRCWRWWGSPSGRPWYNRMILMTQSQDGAWDHAMREVVRRAAWIVKTG